MKAPANQEELEERLSRPTPGVLETLRRVPGDCLILGAGGKMGPSLARMLRRATDEIGDERRIVAVSRFSDPALPASLKANRIEILAADLLDDGAVESLADFPNVFYLAGRKFGSTGNEALTWAMNVDLPARVARRFRNSRIVAFSTGNVYGLTPVAGPGSRESDTPDPVGEYAMSCLGRERMFQHYSQAAGTRVLLYRLNYAVDLRYGVLVDIARQVLDEQPVPLGMGQVNAIWQGDANAFALRALELAAAPACLLNVTGLKRHSVREVAAFFGQRFGKEVRFEGEEGSLALLSNACRCREWLGEPDIDDDTLLHWVSDWLVRGGELIDKPTHFESRDGRY